MANELLRRRQSCGVCALGVRQATGREDPRQVVAFMSNPRLLVVDDHPDTLRLLETFLTLSGFHVVSAANGLDGLTLAANGTDAIATDLAMPEMDGFEFIRRVRALRSHTPVPVVAVTGQSLEAAEVAAQALGCCRVIQKPCDLTELAETLHSLVGTCVHDCDRCPIRRAQPRSGSSEPENPAHE